ncbi:HEPN domain-containing protein [Flavobacterium granuli]|uniref:YopA central domain-containing protein n=1 Tax=Flavobacterium granuli TaxID=280093 RepID=A0ABU1S4J4_9FLAO|nr:HEPN domain-containing protein [Flavobacterium granuli]MDR6845936.1 hypothetical protein [Flavobacterium granuli]
MSNRFLELINTFDDILESPIQMEITNQPIKIFEGEFSLIDDKEEIKIIGNIEYKWLPHKGAIFYGNLIENSEQIISLVDTIRSFDVVCNGNTLGKGFISNFSIGNEITIKGKFHFNSVFGDETIPVDKLKFCIPNFRDFSGNIVKSITETTKKTYKNRIVLENDKYSIIIDKCFDYKKSVELLNDNGGYLILYSGELKAKKGTLTFQNSKEILHCLNIFLCFLNGRRTSALFIHGVYEENTLWVDYSNYNVDSYDKLSSWTNSQSIEGFNELWKTFSDKWKNENDKDVLNTAIHWYMECNKGSGFIEGSLIMAQTALELLYNWYVVENKKLLVGKDSENINASNKIRLLISQLNINYNVPNRFTSLQKFLKSEKLNDAPEAVVQIRNAIVHSQEEKRTKLNNIDINAKREALELCIWYIEMSLLKILNFKDKIYNRCSENLATSSKIERLPWINDGV